MYKKEDVAHEWPEALRGHGILPALDCLRLPHIRREPRGQGRRDVRAGYVAPVEDPKWRCHRPDLFANFVTHLFRGMALTKRLSSPYR